MSIKIAITDDHQLVLQGIKSMLSDTEEVSVVATYSDAQQTIEGLSALEVEVLLLDINLPDENGIDLSKKLLKKQASAFRGWDHLVDKLRAAGASEQQIKEVYQSPRMPKFSYISFNVNPRESTRMYKEFYTKSKLKR